MKLYVLDLYCVGEIVCIVSLVSNLLFIHSNFFFFFSAHLEYAPSQYQVSAKLFSIFSMHLTFSSTGGFVSFFHALSALLMYIVHLVYYSRIVFIHLEYVATLVFLIVT